MRDVYGRLHRTRLVLSCFILVGAGITLIALERHLAKTAGWSWLRAVPLAEIGGTLVAGGILGVWLDYFMRREQQAVDEHRLRTLLHEHAPAMRDAVLEAFAANHEDLARVATPQMLDQVITNSLALRLDDQQFASEIYSDIKGQAVSAQERWYDASLSIELAPRPQLAAVAEGPSPHRTPAPYFTVTVRWEYTTIPRHPQRRFVCLSDREEYAELANDRGSTSAWYFKPASGLDASSPKVFELLRFAVDGKERPIRRASRKTGQTYTVGIDPEHLRAQEPVTVTYTYQLVMAQSGHMLFFDIEQPTRDLRVDFDYTNCGIASVSTLDLVPSVRPTRIETSPGDTPAKTVRADIDGWIFPRSGIAFVWTLTSETPERSKPKGSASDSHP